MLRRYVTVDVFTDRAFGGNPLAVVLDAGGLSTAQMQAIALEFNYSETTFVLPARDAGNDAHVRIFTATREIPSRVILMSVRPSCWRQGPPNRPRG
jgi:trans-2,3-dihydro-3-hydroxyanthranilate isomerase